MIALRTTAHTTALQSMQAEIGLQRSALDVRRNLFELRQKLGAEERDYVYLTGEVENQNRVALPYQQQATLADVLYSEGGFDNTTGDPTQIYVLRADTRAESIGSITAYHLNVKNAADTLIATRFEMRANDVIFIEEQAITKWGRALQQMFPSLLSATSAATGGG